MSLDVPQQDVPTTPLRFVPWPRVMIWLRQSRLAAVTTGAIALSLLPWVSMRYLAPHLEPMRTYTSDEVATGFADLQFWWFGGVLVSAILAAVVIRRRIAVFRGVAAAIIFTLVFVTGLRFMSVTDSWRPAILFPALVGALTVCQPPPVAPRARAASAMLTGLAWLLVIGVCELAVVGQVAGTAISDAFAILVVTIQLRPGRPMSRGWETLRAARPRTRSALDVRLPTVAQPGADLAHGD
jgi:hypothetical protein